MTTTARPLLALTLTRPWQILIAKGIKRIENRTWLPGPRLLPGEWFAIHAGQSYDTDCQPMATRLGVSLDTFFGELSATPSAIVAVARYGGVVTASKDPWFFGPYGWVLDQVVEVQPVRCRGAQGLWRVPQIVADEVREGYRCALQIRAAERASQ